MRILHVTDVYRPRVGGIELFVEELAARQTEAGHAVTVLSPTADDPGSTAARFEVVRTPTPAPWPLPFLPRRDLRLASYDVVHAHLSVVSPFSSRVAKAAVAAGTPTIATVHSMWTGREGWVRLVGAIGGWHRWPIVWTAVSAASARSMRGPLGLGTGIQVVPNAVDVPWWRELPPRDDPTRPFTMVSVMRLAGRKRPMPLLDVLARVRDAVPPDVPLRAVLVGEGPLEDRLRARVQSLRMEDWVELAGARSREEIRETYRSADAYVAPSHQESFGLAALEARAAGVPVVGMRSGGVGEFVSEGVEGFLCEDDDELTGVLVRLATDEPLRRRVAGHNRTHAPGLDWSVALDGFADAYDLAAEAVCRTGRPGLGSGRR